jgi:hypothetical protein
MKSKILFLYFFTSLIVTIGAFFLSSLTRLEFQTYLLWKSVNFTLISGYIDFSLFFFIHNTLGSFIFLLGSYQCLKIVKVNNQAHDGKNKPNTLIEEGYYAVCIGFDIR